LQKDTILTVGIKEISTPFQFGNIFFDGDYITQIQEKPLIKTNIIAGIYVYKPEIFALIENNQPLDLDKLINRLLYDNIRISKYEIIDYWLDIGRVTDYQDAQDFYKEHFSEGK